MIEVYKSLAVRLLELIGPGVPAYAVDCQQLQARGIDQPGTTTEKCGTDVSEESDSERLKGAKGGLNLKSKTLCRHLFSWLLNGSGACWIGSAMAQSDRAYWVV
jgi:hypothetical protein